MLNFSGKNVLYVANTEYQKSKKDEYLVIISTTQAANPIKTPPLMQQELYMCFQRIK